MSFGSEPGRDDGSLPPVNIVVPDDARELDRDVLAYRREQRARRRRERLMWLLRPLRRHGLGGHGTILPLIATCVALSMLAGAMLSVVTISPASAPTISPSAPGGRPGQANSRTGTAPPSTALPAGLTELPSGTLTLDRETGQAGQAGQNGQAGQTAPVRTLTSAAIVLIPANCGCGTELRRLAGQASAARAGLYFVGEGRAIAGIRTLTARYGGAAAVAAADPGNVLGTAYRPAGLTVLLVYSDATARVRRGLPVGFQLGPALRALTRPGR